MRPAAISYMLIRSPRSPRNDDSDALEASRLLPAVSDAIKSFTASWQRLADTEAVADIYHIAAVATTLHHHVELQQSRSEDGAPPPSSAALRQLLKSIQQAQSLLERLARAVPIARLLDGCDVHQDLCSIKQGLKQGVEGLVASSRTPAGGGEADGQAPQPAAAEAGSDAASASGRVEGASGGAESGVSRSASQVAPAQSISQQQHEQEAQAPAEAAGAAAAAAAGSRTRLDSHCPLLQDAAARLAAWKLPEAPELAQVMQALQSRRQQQEQNRQQQPAGEEEDEQRQGQDASSPAGQEENQAPRQSQMMQEQMLQEQRLRELLWAALDSLQMSLPELRSQLELADRNMGGRSDLQLQVGAQQAHCC